MDILICYIYITHCFGIKPFDILYILELYDRELTFLMVRLKDLEIMVGYGIHNENM